MNNDSSANRIAYAYEKDSENDYIMNLGEFIEGFDLTYNADCIYYD